VDTTKQQADTARLERLWQQVHQGALAPARRAALAWQDAGDAPPGLDLLLARLAQAAGDPAEALALYRRMAAGDGETALAAHLGWADVLIGAGQDLAAERVLQALLARAPSHFVALLWLAELREARGEQRLALDGFYAAVVQAQRQGRWLGDGSTAPAMRPRVRHAMEAIDRGRRALFLSLLEPLRQRYGRDALERVERGLLMYLGALPTEHADPRQQPTFFYVPGIPSAPYPPRALFPWLEQLEAATAAIREEMLATRAQAGAYAPFLGAPASELRSGLVAGDGPAPAWDAYFFYRHGGRDAAHAQQCPLTSAALERTPLVKIRDHAPEICFSVLAPGSHILPHRGVTNTRLTAHLPLLVPGDCALRAGGELHVWQEGRAMVFDDSFEHEAWNRSDQTRVILLMDTWNPHLRAEEREAVTNLVEAIGDFNAQVPAA
jgi:aspartate beta-hydroxylase